MLNAEMLFVAGAPAAIRQPASVYVRAVRSALRMTQLDLAERSGVRQAHIALIEAGRPATLRTLTRLFDAMFCDLLILPAPWKRLSDVVAEQRLEARRPFHLSPWGKKGGRCGEDQRRWPARPGRRPKTTYERQWPWALDIEAITFRPRRPRRV